MNSTVIENNVTSFFIKLIKIIASIFILFYLLIWAISSPLSKYFIEPLLLEQGLTLSTNSRLYYNPFLSQLIVRDFTLYKNQQKVLSVVKLTVEITLHEVLYDKIVVSKFTLNDAYLNIVKTPKQLFVAGIDVNKFTENTAEETTPETPEKPLPYQVILPNLTVNNFKFDVNNNGVTHQIAFNSLFISDVEANTSQQKARLRLETTLDSSPVTLTADAKFEQGQGEITSELSLTNYPIHKILPYVSDLSELSGLLSFESKQKITIMPDVIKLQVTDAKLRNRNLVVGYQQQFIHLENFETTLEDLKLTLDHGELTDLSSTSVLTLSNGNINYKGSTQKTLPYISELSELSGTFSVQSNQKITLSPEVIKLQITDAKLQNSDVMVGYQQQFINLENFETTLEDLQLTLDHGELTDLSGTSQLVLNNANVYYKTPSQRIAYFKQFSLNDIHLHFNNEPQINIANIMIDDILASKNETTNLPPLVTLKQLNINDIIVSSKQLSINNIKLDSLQSEIVVTKESTVANLVQLPITPAEGEKLPEVATKIDQEITLKESPFIVSLNEVTFENDNHIVLLDNNVEPVKPHTLYIDKFRVGKISNDPNQQEQKTPFELTGRSNKYAKFDLKGFTQPFANKPIHHIAGFIKEVSLPDVSRYMKKATKLALKSGQLNTDIKVTLTGDQLEGNMLLVLRSLETAIGESDEAGALIDQGALPFNMALDMLKDSHGDVELDVPLSGSTSDPSFGMSSIVSLITQKAVWMATQDYLMTTFVPYANIVSVAMKVGEFALKLRFDDLIYETKQIEPSEAQQAYLKAFIALMQDKEKTRVNICGISTPADIDLENGIKITNKAQIHQLKEIAEQREAAFKDYMIKEGNIASSRLLLCAPKIDSSKMAKARIALSV